MADAELDAAVEAAYAGAFWSAGQKCTATRRIYVQDARLRRVPRALLARIAAARSATRSTRRRGRPAGQRDPVRGGPRRRSRAAATRAARCIAGGQRADPDAYLIAPTVFEDVGDDAFLSLRGGVRPGDVAVSLRDARRGDRARERASLRPVGGGLHHQPRDRDALHRTSSQAGILHVNSQTAGADVHVPFGGIKESRLRSARAGPRGDRVLHRGDHRLPRRLSGGRPWSSWGRSTRRASSTRTCASGSGCTA